MQHHQRHRHDAGIGQHVRQRRARAASRSTALRGGTVTSACSIAGQLRAPCTQHPLNGAARSRVARFVEVIVDPARRFGADAPTCIKIVDRGALDRLEGAEMLQQRALAASARCPAISSSRPRGYPSCAARGASRWRSGAPRRAAAGRNRAPGRAAAVGTASRPGMKKRLAPGIAVRALGDRRPAARSSTPSSASASRTAVICPCRRRSAPGRARADARSSSSAAPTSRRPAVGMSAAARGALARSAARSGASITSRIMPKSSPGVRSSERMLNLRYWFLRNPSGPATIMAPTALVPLMWELS